MNALIANFIPTLSVIVTILLVGLALGSLVYRGQARLESRLAAVENRTKVNTPACLGQPFVPDR